MDEARQKVEGKAMSKRWDCKKCGEFLAFKPEKKQSPLGFYSREGHLVLVDGLTAVICRNCGRLNQRVREWPEGKDASPAIMEAMKRSELPTDLERPEPIDPFPEKKERESSPAI